MTFDGHDSFDEHGSFDEHDGTFEGRRFPDESEWLGTELPDDFEISDDFVDHTVIAVRSPTPEQLQAFDAPAPSADFVSRVTGAIQQDRREHWREMLARYVAPEPSPEFVSRTLRALEERAAERAQRDTEDARATGSPGVGPRGIVPAEDATGPENTFHMWRRWGMPLVAAAAVIIAAFLLPGDPPRALEVRAAESLPAAFGAANATSPLPALLTHLDQEADPYGLPNTGGDGVWLLMQRSTR
ncbi:MAG: hypothetical protein NXI31_02000 [bacterium]|nr:hypothetical protein [bacterium]